MIDQTRADIESSQLAHLTEDRLRLGWLAAGLAFLTFAGYGSLVPFHFHPGSFSAAWEQMLTTKGDVLDGSRVDWGVNALLFAPAGFCLLAAAVRANSRLVGRIFWTIAVASACLLASFLIEFAQSWFPPRVPSLADVMAQFWGAAAGLACWWLFGGYFHSALEQFASGRSPRSRLDLVLLLYLTGLLIFSLAPLDLTLHPKELLQKYRDGRILLVPFSYRYSSVWALAYDLLADVILFIPVGILATTAFTRVPGAVRSVATSMLLASVVVCGIELLQLPIMSRFVDATDLLTGGLGTLIGILGCRYAKGRPSAGEASLSGRQIGLTIAAVLYSVFVLAIYWAPYDFTLGDGEHIRQRWSGFFGVPLSRALEGSYLAAFNGFLQKFVLFAPLGGMIAVFVVSLKPSRRSIAGLVLLGLAAGFALFLEIGQLLLPSRSASFDDVIIGVAGLVFGFSIANALNHPLRTKDRTTHPR